MKKVEYLIKYANAQVGRPYWSGTYGQIADAALLAYKRQQYPKNYPQPGNPAFTSQYGNKVHDCNGLVNGARECDTPDSKPNKYPDPYYSVKGLYDACKTKGTLTLGLSLLSGTLLFRNNFGHVGIYDGEGNVIHAKGHKYGVVKEKYNVYDWQYFGQLECCFDYGTATTEISIKQPATIRRGSKGYEVKVWQQILLGLEFDLGEAGVDGVFGSKTLAATKAFQKFKGLTVDGIVGKFTWTAGLNTLA